MQAHSDIVDFFERIANIAQSAQRKVSYLLVAGLLATAYLGFELVSAASPLWWNILKVILVATPVLIWCFVWSVLGGLTQAPVAVANLASGQSELIHELKSINEPRSLRGLFSAVRAFRREEGFGVLFDAVSGIGMIASPLFAIMAFVALPLLLLLVLVSVVVLIF